MLRIVLALVLVATVVVSAPFAQTADAQEDGLQTLEVWGVSDGLVPNPKDWKFYQSDSEANHVGSATAAQVSFDDSSWATETLRWKEFPGPGVANHFRKDFTLDEIGVEMFEIEGIQVGLLYDDTAVMYLNGVEVYRSIRGNLDPTYETYGLGDDMGWDSFVSWGGYEDNYVQIPDPNQINDCQHNLPCPESPYGSPHPPAIPVGLLNQDGVNTWAVTTWNQTGGGSGDSSIDHVFQLLIDPDAVEPNPIFINEAMASNDTAYGVQLDDDPELEHPDWFELINVSDSPVNLQGWTISDNSESFVFPSVVVPANGYLIVVANDKNLTNTTPLQTNFKLSSEGDSLKLRNPESFIVDEYLALPQQFADNSYGRGNDTGTPSYLASPTPGGPNSALGDGYAPILRPFANRMYNVGETVSQSVNAFDPDGDTLSYALTPKPPGLDIDDNGLITGQLNSLGSFASTLTVTDSDNDSASQLVQWVVLPAPVGPAPLVLNEYNAVPEDSEFLIGGELGNGGDWFEFVVIEDQLDLRGFSIEFYDQKGADDQLRLAAAVNFANDDRLARAPAGTIITISQDNPTDLDFDAVNDWHINLQVDTGGAGELFGPPALGSVFNSTRSGQTVLIKDASGLIVTPLSGETDGWDNINGGVSGSEVMSLCVDPTPGMVLDPIADYTDNGFSTSFGQPNTCQNPLDPAIELTQSFNALRSSATLGATSGDVNCDLVVNVTDALLVAQYSVGNRSDSGPCHFDQGGAGFEMYASGGDIDGDGSITVTDALIIARCSVGIPLQWCSE